MADFVGVLIWLIGVGPGREQMIWAEAGRSSAAARRRPAPESRPSVESGVHEEVVQRPVLLVPQRPKVVDPVRQAARQGAVRYRTAVAFTTTSRITAKPNVTSSPLARTTRIPVAIRPSVFPFVRAIIAGA